MARPYNILSDETTEFWMVTISKSLEGADTKVHRKLYIVSVIPEDVLHHSL